MSKNIFYTYSTPQEDVVISWLTLLKGTIFDEFDVECIESRGISIKIRSVQDVQENSPTVEFLTSSTPRSNKTFFQIKFSFPPLLVFIPAVSFPLKNK
jgi:hypothetical protein